MSRRKKRGPTPRCEACGVAVKSIKTWTGSYRPFGRIAINPNVALVPNAYPFFAGRVWLLEDLVDELMVRAAQSRAEANDEAYALPWYVAHACHHHTINEEND